MDLPRGFKGVWIPKEIWLSSDFTTREKLLIVEIDSLDREKGCYASNKHFAEFLEVSEHRISQMISSLKARGFLKVEQTNVKGKTIRTLKSAWQKIAMRGGATSNLLHDRLAENVKASISNTLSNTTPAAGSTSPAVVAAVIDAFRDVNPTGYEQFFGNRTERAAAERIAKLHGLERVVKVVALLRQTNQAPYMPTIISPWQLEKKWASLEAGLRKEKAKAMSKGRGVEI